MAGALVVFGLCALLLLLIPLVLYLLTYVFRLACALSGVPKPSVLAATGIILVNFVADAVALTILEAVVRSGGEAAGLDRWESVIITRLLDLPVDLVISSAVHAGLMGIRFGKGLEIWFVQRLIQLGIATAIGLVALIVYLAGA
ncbi:MAG: hypothetical protein K2X87_05045 [Gemmataceae bacterium]|nr:hypothetical protein [Gemmataceae bacterium]